jgi:sulfoxide reductase heme-binding subunit YedZ
VNPLHYPWWLASRSMGIVAYFALTVAVTLGLAMALRLGRFRVLHERVALLAVGAIAAHGLLLVPDPWLKAGVSGVLVPFTMSYRPLWTGLGVCAGYLAAGLSLSYYARRKIGARRWRNAHRFIPIAWLLATVHLVMAGTDGRSLWLLIPLAAPVAAALTLLIYRLAVKRSGPPLALPKRSRTEPAGTSTAAPPAAGTTTLPPLQRTFTRLPPTSTVAVPDDAYRGR